MSTHAHNYTTAKLAVVLGSQYLFSHAEKSSNFEMGYKDFMLELFGENIILMDGKNVHFKIL